MCGFAGFIDSHPRRSGQELERICRAMNQTLAHRGPDGSGQWVDPAGGAALGHRRLSIIDLSPAGAQPMLSHDGNLVLAYNGEVYNFEALRRRLESGEPELAGRWRGRSDSEVLLQAIAAWGLEEALAAANGMFALALWDRREKRLFLARDRLGQKPLYYGWAGGSLVFASELKALAPHPDFQGRVDRRALGAYVRHGYLAAPHCIFQGLYKLPPGCLVCLDPARRGESPQPRAYWSLEQAMIQGLADPLTGPPREAVDRLEELLGDAVHMRMISDVPLGALLSGGIDSSTVVALMARRSKMPVRTFSIGFSQASHDEAPFARQVAEHLGTDHTELYVSPQEALEVVPLLPRMYDEPFGDSSQIPTYLVSRLARQQVTVALSGDGGDEAFMGYDRYFWAQRLARVNRRAPLLLRRALAGALTALPTKTWDRLLRGAMAVLPRRLGKSNPADNLDRVANLLPCRGERELYRRLMSPGFDPAGVVRGSGEADTIFSQASGPEDAAPYDRRMMYWDGISYLPGDILTKVDRASMAVSLEARSPLLDHRVVELAWRMPAGLLALDGQGKWPLRQVAYRHLPRRLLDRPKMGFGVPLAAWLRGPLKDWGAALLEPGRLEREGWFDPRPIAQAWQEHQSGRRDQHHQLWTVLMFQAWLENQSAV